MGAVRIIAYVVLLVAVVIVVLPFLGTFTKMIAASPTDKAVTSFKDLAISTKNVISQPGLEKEDFDMYLPRDYYITTEFEGGEQLLVLKKEGEKKAVDKMVINGLADRGICCNKGYDNLGACNTYCGEGNKFLLGKGKSVNGEICVVTTGGVVNVYRPGADFECITF